MPFVLLLDLSGSWEQVCPFIQRNRVKGLPFCMPIVVLTQNPPPFAVADRLNMKGDLGLGVRIGHPVWQQDLKHSGVSECCVIVCLGIRSDPVVSEGGAAEILDADVVML